MCSASGAVECGGGPSRCHFVVIWQNMWFVVAAYRASMYNSYLSYILYELQKYNYLTHQIFRMGHIWSEKILFKSLRMLKSESFAISEPFITEILFAMMYWIYSRVRNSA